MTKDLGLALVADPNGDHCADIVFLHGLGGHRSQTFRNKNGGFLPLWVRDAIPTARVWTYGHDYRAFGGSKDCLVLQATKLLQALVDSGIGRKVCFWCLHPTASPTKWFRNQVPHLPTIGRRAR